MRESHIRVEPENRSAWRAWLSENHAAYQAVSVVIRKTGPKANRLTLHEAQEEALCFGWVDVRNRRIDDKQYELHFTPRKPGSAWSVSNIERVERMEQAGLMTEAGRQAVREAQANGQWEMALRVERTEEVPAGLNQALTEVRGALERYEGLAHSRKKQILRRYLSAKSSVTRRRIEEGVVREVLAGAQMRKAA